MYSAHHTHCTVRHYFSTFRTWSYRGLNLSVSTTNRPSVQYVIYLCCQSSCCTRTLLLYRKGIPMLRIRVRTLLVRSGPCWLDPDLVGWIRTLLVGFGPCWLDPDLAGRIRTLLFGPGPCWSDPNLFGRILDLVGRIRTLLVGSGPCWSDPDHVSRVRKKMWLPLLYVIRKKE